jgi:DNA recombination protein RmuC
MIVHLPAGRQIVVDSKVSLTAYLDAVAATTEDERRVFMTKHAQQVRLHMNQLAAKNYWDQFEQTPEFVVMFIPGEAFFAAAVDHDHTLMEDAMGRRVALVSPMTLWALLGVVAYGWRQEQIRENARQISELGKRLYDRLKTMSEHVNSVGSALERAVKAYNDAVGSMERRVFPAARRFKDLGAATGEEIELLEPVQEPLRGLGLPEPDDDGFGEPEGRADRIPQGNSRTE